MFRPIILILRPQQWVKNLFIFLPLFFDGKLLEVSYLLPAFATFLAYCFAASGIYCLNDILDTEADRKHPLKCKRPIASGAIRKSQGYLLMLCCFGTSFSIITLPLWNIDNPKGLAAVIGFYIIMNIAYCVKLKKIAIIDIFTIATGFVLRLLAGGLATSIKLSQWIVLMVFLLALFLAFAKRRDDVRIYEENGVLVRNTAKYYTLPFMDQVIMMTASIVMVCYILYTVSPDVTARFHNHYLYITSIFVLAALIRYLQITANAKSGSPTKILLKDRFIQVCIIAWTISFILIIYQY